MLPQILKCEEYVNADSIAAGLSPFHPENVQIQAGRLMLERIRYLVARKVDFAFESTLASRTFINFLLDCKKQGYEVNILFLWLNSVEIEVDRVSDRVKRGGHDIPHDVITRRYFRSINNFVMQYIKIADSWFLYDNSDEESRLIACKKLNCSLSVLEFNLWQKINLGVKNAK